MYTLDDCNIANIAGFYQTNRKQKERSKWTNKKEHAEYSKESFWFYARKIFVIVAVPLFAA